MKLSTILAKSKKAIDYFSFKKQFAKNKEYHQINVEALEQMQLLANNLLNSKKEIVIIESLILELYTYKLIEWKDQKTALKKVGEIIEHPKATKERFKDFISANIFFKYFQNNFEDIEEFYKNEEEIKNNTDKLTEEMLTIFKDTIEWI